MAKFLAYRKKLSVTEDDFAADADIWLFADDLLNFVFRNHAGFPIIPTGEERRKCVHRGFTNTVKFAVELTKIKLSDEIDAVFAEISNKDDVVEAYCKYVTHLRTVLRSGGFDGGQFIQYCVFVAFLGEKFYRAGLHDFHYEAFAAVRRGFKKSDMSNGGWNILESAAEAIISVAEPVENPRRNVPSPDVEQSSLEKELEQSDMDYILNSIISDSDCLSDSSVGSDNSIPKAPSLTLKGSVESLSLCNVSDDESEKLTSEGLSSRDFISPRKRLAQSSKSSSTEILKLPTPKDNFLESYTEKNIHVIDTNYGLDDFHEEIIDLQDISKHSDPNESFHLSTTSPEHLSPSDQVAKRNKTEPKKVDVRSEKSSETENSQKENEIPLDWPFSPPVEQVSKPNSESRRLPIFSELFTKAQEPNSAESTASTSKSSGFPKFPSF